MIVHTACATCAQPLELSYDDALAGRNTHESCRPTARPGSDELFDKFSGIVAKMAAPEYKPNQHDDLNLGALQQRIDALDHAPPRLADAAVWYSQNYGWPVFPLKPGTKVPATPHGFKGATTDVDRIRRFWDQAPTHNIGIPTGVAFDVVDVDLPDGPASWDDIRAQGVIAAAHGIVRTSSGGLHILIEPTGQGNTARISPGIDYRGAGGYIVAAPSWLGTPGSGWQWISKPSPRITNGEKTTA